MLKKQKPIGIFDSGLGGLTAVRSILQFMPNEDIIYFGDTARVPYGGRSPSIIRTYTLQDASFLMDFDVKALVIACNTMDSIARDEVEKTFQVPVIGAVAPAAEKAVQMTKNNRIGVIGTKATIRSEAYSKAILEKNPSVTVFPKACPLLVPLVENGRFHRDDPAVKLIVEDYLSPLRAENIDTLILGCTHYPLLEDVIRDCMPDTNIICSGRESVFALQSVLSEKDLLADASHIGTQRYFVSDDENSFRDNAELFIGSPLQGRIGTVKME